MNDLIEKLSDMRNQYNCFDENEYEAYHTLSEAIKVLSERPKPCEDNKGCSNCMYSGRPTYKSPCSECHDNSQWEMKPISRSHENGTECEDAVSRADMLETYADLYDIFEDNDQIRKELNKVYDKLNALSSVTLKLDHSGDATEMVEYDDCVSRQAVIDTARKVSSIFEGEYDTRTPYGVVLDVQDAVSKLPPVTPKPEPCEDAVSRKDAIIQLSHNKNGDPDCDVIIQHDIETLKRMPPVTPKRKTGKWIEYDSEL